MDSSSIRFKQLLINTFLSFDALCRENSIKYFAAYGTLIGAIRHHGLIPWDDDIDVWMLPEDYAKFCSLKGKITSHYDIIDSRDKNYWLFTLVKFVDTNTTLWESEQYPCVTGVYIDVFPLNECDEESGVRLRREYDRTTYNLTYAIADHPFSKLIGYLSKGHLRTFLKYAKEKFYYRPRYHKYLREYEECLAEIHSTRGDKFVSYDGLYHEKEIFDKNCFEEVLDHDFEGIKIMIPKGYESILTKLYGDYMQLPPEEKRVSHHSHYFLDLDRRWSIEEIKEYKKTH